MKILSFILIGLVLSSNIAHSSIEVSSLSDKNLPPTNHNDTNALFLKNLKDRNNLQKYFIKIDAFDDACFIGSCGEDGYREICKRDSDGGCTICGITTNQGCN